MVTSPDQRSPIAVAYQWAGRVINVSLEMVLPGLAGLWLDHKLGTKILFAVLGFSLGITGGIWHLIRMTEGDKKKQRSPEQSDSIK